MDKDSSNKIVDRLRAEGSLIRNTGTNSIKSVRTDLAKFGALFESINSNIIEQTQILRNSLKIQIDEEKIRKSAKELLRADRTVAEKSKEKVGSTSSPKFTSDQQAGGFLASLAGLFGGAAVGIGGSLLAALKTPLRTALFTVLAPAVGTLLGNITEEALLNMGSDPGTALKFGEAANLAGMWGMIGLAFGKRAGVIGAVAGVAASFGDEVLDAVGLDKNKMVTLFGQEMKLETVAKGIMGALGASMATAVTSPAFMTSLGSFFKNTVGPDGEVISRFARRRALIGGTIAAAVLGAYITYGDDLKKWIEEQNLPEPVEGVATAAVDIAGMTATGANFGLMFGPQGAIVGAAIGFALGVGIQLFNWVNERREAARLKVAQDIAEANAILDDEDKVTELEKTAETLSLQTPEEQAKTTAKMTDAEIIALDRVITEKNFAQDEVTFLKGEIEPFILMGQPAPVDMVNKLAAAEKNLAELEAAEAELKASGAPKSKPEQIPTAITKVIGIPELRTGSKGFQDFGAGSFAVLHGREAVIPEQTPAGQFLKSYFDENWEPRLASKINQASGAAVAMGGTTTVIINSPITNAPITSVNNGGNSSSTMVVSGVGGRADLDARSIPYGAN